MADVKDFLAGFFAGIVSLLVSHPLDTIKVRQQSYNCNLFMAVRNTAKYEGLRGFYKGLTFPLLTWGPSNSLFFGVYGNWLKIADVDADRHQMNPTSYEDMKRVFYAGCVAGLPQAMFYCPVEYIKTILQANAAPQGELRKSYVIPYTGVMDALKGIYKEDGIKGLYKGFWAMCIRDVPTSGIYVLAYEMIRLSTPDNIMSSKLAKEVVAGGSAGILSLVAALPLDVVKTSIQTDNPHQPVYNGMIDCTRKLYAQSGFRIFFKGLPVLCMRAFPAHAIMFTSYEFIMSL